MDNNYYGGKKQKKNVRADIEQKTGRGWHSQPYHAYFEDFAEYEVTDENGKVKIIRSYAGEWYLAHADSKELFRKKIWISVLWLLSAAVFAFASTRQTVANASWYATIFEFAVVILMVWNLIAIINYYTVKGAMVVSKFKRTVLGFRRSSQGAVLAFAGCALATLAAIIFTNSIRVWTWVSFGGFVLDAGMMFLSNYIERGIMYEKNPSKEVVPEDAVIIE